MDTLYPVIAAAVVSIAAAVVSFGLARRIGLTSVQRSYAEESQRLAETLKSRVQFLESENTRLKAEVQRLETENEDLRRRVSRVEKMLVDRDLEDGG
jgi:predicted nuclease with TOPRIM domain